MVKRGRLYYLLYSGNDWSGAYGMGYASVALAARAVREARDEPVPPDAPAGIVRARRRLGGRPARGARLWLAYHARAAQGIGYADGRRRSLHLDRLIVGGGRVRMPGPSLQSSRSGRSPPMIAVVLGLTSSLCWGIADFMGGVASRRISVLTVLVISQIVGLLLLLVVVAIRAEGPPEAHHLAVAALSSVAGVGALAAFYRGLAVGTDAVVAPISATAAVIPVVAGVATGRAPGRCCR